MKSIDWSAETLKSYDAVLIATDHDNIDRAVLVDNAKLIIDTRNVLKNWQDTNSEKIVKA